VRPFADTISIDEARRLIREAIAPLVRDETIALDVADGRVLAEDVAAPMDQPPFDRSAMDGYAVRAADVAGATRDVPKVLQLIGRAYTAEPFAGTLAPGDCVEIATGAPIPAGADAVVMVEDTGRPGTADWPAPAWLDSGEQVLVLAEVRPGQHAIRRGSDMRANDVVLRAGQAITPSRIGALAAIGRDRVRVVGKPIVAIFPTGNEVVRQGQPLPLASVYDVNSFTVAALVGRHGGIAERHAPVPDTIEAVWAFKEVQGIQLSVNPDNIGPATERALADPKDPVPLTRHHQKNRIDVNLGDPSRGGYLVLYRHGHVRLISHISPGGGYYFCDGGLRQNRCSITRICSSPFRIQV
jgi:molybdopterin biosynthesis enzyme